MSYGASSSVQCTPAALAANMGDVQLSSGEHEHIVVCPEDRPKRGEDFSFLTDTEWSSLVGDVVDICDVSSSDQSFYSAESGWSAGYDELVLPEERPRAFMRNRAEPTRMGSFSTLERKATAIERVQFFWVAVHLTFTSFNQFERTMHQVQCPEGYACAMYPLLEAGPDEWQVTFVAGVIDRGELDGCGISVGQALNTMFPFVGETELCTFEFAELIPWGEYREWVSKRRVLLDASLYPHVMGDGMELVEARCYRQVQAQMG